MKNNYKTAHKPSKEFETREEYLDNELSITKYRSWKVHLPFKDYKIELEDWVPAIAATIGKVVMTTALVTAFATQFGLSPAFIVENVRYEMLIAGILFVLLFSAILNPKANLAGCHGPMIPLVPIIAMAGGHPLALGIMIGVFGLFLSVTKGGSKLMSITGIGVRGGLLIYLGMMGLVGQIKKLNLWASEIKIESTSILVLGITILLYAYLSKIKKRWLAIPLCSIIAGIIAYSAGADFSFTSEPGFPRMNPSYWWGENTGWKLGWPNLNQFISVIPFAILAVSMWTPDFLGHRVFQEMNYPKEAKNPLMDMDDTMTVASLRQIVGTFLGGGNITSSWGTYMIPAAIAKRPIPAGALLTALLCVATSILGFPMDLAMWEPVLRIALIVGVFLPLLEAGMQMINIQQDSLTAGTCIFACAVVNPVFGWALTMLLDNIGFIGDKSRAQNLSLSERVILPGIMFLICTFTLVITGQIPGIPSIF